MGTDKLPTLPELIRRTNGEIMPENGASASQNIVQSSLNNTASEQEQPTEEPVVESNVIQEPASTASFLSKIFDDSQNTTLKAVWQEALLQHYKSKIPRK